MGSVVFFAFDGYGKVANGSLVLIIVVAFELVVNGLVAVVISHLVDFFVLGTGVYVTVYQRRALLHEKISISRAYIHFNREFNFLRFKNLKHINVIHNLIG
jgi:hypothetical protein